MSLNKNWEVAECGKGGVRVGKGQRKLLFFSKCNSIWYLNLALLNPDMPCLCKQCRSRSVGLKKPADLDLHCYSVCRQFLTFTLLKWTPCMLGKNFSRQHFEIFFLFFENRIWHFIQIVAWSIRSYFLQKIKKNKTKKHQFVICWTCL